jgi:hypothetical protein
MDETNTRWFRWTADNAPHFPWVLWGALFGAFVLAALQGVELFNIFAEHGEAVIAAFTVVLAVSTIGLWNATRQLWKAGEKQIELARITAEAAQTSAEASRSAVKQAEQTAERQLRAYVTITKHRALHYRTVPGQVIVPCVSLRNRGHTPAHNVMVTTMARYDLADRAKTLELEADPSSPFTLVPGEKTTITADLPALDEEMIGALDSGAKVLILLCEVRYTDVFGNSRRTRMRASSNKNADVDANGTMQLEWHGSDNDAT